MGVGRVACVAVPFLLTLGSLIALLVAGLAGVTNKDLYMFQVNTTDLSISPATAANIIQSITSRDDVKTTNITAADLGLYNLYDIGLWGYCYEPQTGDRTCTKPAFNWAESALNQTAGNLTTLVVAATGQTVQLPTQITDAMKAFASVSKWTEVVFIVAYVALALELLLGLFANCSRGASCLTWLVAALATVAVCGAAGMATAMSVVVVGAVEGTAKFYGVEADFNTRFLAAVWLAAALALAAGFFWLFTICCCAPDHSSRRRSSAGRARHLDEYEKPLPVGAYQPLGDQGHAPQQYGYHSYQQPASNQYNKPSAYEPYSHHQHSNV